MKRNSTTRRFSALVHKAHSHRYKSRTTCDWQQFHVYDQKFREARDLMMAIATNRLSVERCPHCAIAMPLLEYRHYVLQQHDSASGAYSYWITYQCSACRHTVQAYMRTYKAIDKNNAAGWLSLNASIAEQVLPVARDVPDSLPPRAENYLRQAMAALNAPDGSIMLSASAIDAMLKDKGYLDGSLYARINQAASDHLITLEMSQWAHSIRLESNNPRHADLDDPHATLDDAERVVSLAVVLGEFIYSIPARIRQGRGEQ